MVAAGVIAGAIRLVVGLLRTPMLKEVWTKVLPWWAKPATLLGTTALFGLADALGFHQSWFLALGAAITGLGGAVVSHEWSALFKEAKTRKLQEERLSAVEALMTPPQGIRSPPDTVPDGKPMGSKPN